MCRPCISNGLCAYVLSHFSHVQLFVSLQTIQPDRLLSLWDSAVKNTEVACHAHLQGIFPTQGSNPRFMRLLRCRRVLYCQRYLLLLLLSRFSRVRLCATPQMAAHQAPLFLVSPNSLQGTVTEKHTGCLKQQTFIFFHSSKDLSPKSRCCQGWFRSDFSYWHVHSRLLVLLL